MNTYQDLQNCARETEAFLAETETEQMQRMGLCALADVGRDYAATVAAELRAQAETYQETADKARSEGLESLALGFELKAHDRHLAADRMEKMS